MKWTKEAEESIKRVPFFIRKRVRSRVEKEAIAAGRNVVTLKEVKSTQARYLSNMESEIKGFRVETCFGSSGCPNRANETENLVERIELRDYTAVQSTVAVFALFVAGISLFMDVLYSFIDPRIRY